MIVWWIAVLVGVAECGMMGTCQLSGPTSKVTLMKAVDELVWADSQVLGCQGIFTVGLLQPLEFDVAVRGPKTG